ncbi:MAG: xanthine dehydrogenase family protein molybdopterin-binding subunit [Candidatus Eremiobacteraeota bacterium]|nr:xanthine dehydrogenase family protein molybdopterin-binding subunit [Candidatus Eremiobacteraeota bacterium]
MDTVIGTSRVRPDAAAKVRGETVYVADLPVHDALTAVLVRSPHRFARIRRLDTRRAAQLPGVVAIAHRDTVPDTPLDFGIKDQHLFPREYVRYAGEPVVAIAAETLEQARAAAAAVEIDYEPLPCVDNVEQALAPDAPLVHPDWETYEHGASRVLRGNICGQNRISRGDVDAALARAHVTVTSNFRFSAGIPGYIEPRAALARKEADGGLTVFCGSQSPYGNRDDLAAFFGLAPERVRFINQFVGGAFGGKILMAAEWYAAALALQCDRPVRLVFSRHEDGLNVFPRHGGIATFTSGAAADGTLLAMRASFVFDTGAYIGYGAGTGLIATMLASAPYRIANVDLQATLVYTNKQVAGPVRAPGGPQATWAKELHIDEIARRLDMDPLEMRLKNAWEDGDVSATGQTLRSVSVKEALRRAADAIGWQKTRAPGHGRGIACSWWFSSCSRSEARVEIRSDGSVHLHSGNPEVGTGSAAAALPIVVADRLGIDPSAVTLTLADTATKTYDSGVGGSGSTFSAGLAALQAAEAVRARLIERAEDLLEARREDIDLHRGKASVRGAPDHALSFAEIAAGSGGSISGSGTAPEIGDPEFDAESVESHDFASWLAPSFVASAAAVRVDAQTGRVEVQRIVTAQDVGHAVNPTGIIGQIEGGAVQGLGFGLTEELRFGEQGIENPGFQDYLMPTALDAPAIESIIIERPSGEGPLGMKGVGEPPVTTPAAAIGNAIRDAIGTVPYTTPMTPERVWRAACDASAQGPSEYSSRST